VSINKRDLLGCVQTGTGKTAAFAIPFIQLLSKAFQNCYQDELVFLILII
jgi:superfamily II DNA/RNA helicase